MIPHLRQQFNKRFTEEKYQRLLHRLDELCGMHIDFRICETPLFISSELMHSMVVAGKEIIMQLMKNPSYHAAALQTIPQDFNVPNETEHPVFVSVDFGITRDDRGVYIPRLIELQGFPTLYAFQIALSQEYKHVYALPEEARVLLDGLDLEKYSTMLRRAILGVHDPTNVVLLELDPLTQKTRPDFILTERLFGIATVNIKDVRKEGKQLFYGRNGKQTRILRIYNRAIADELIRSNAQLPFSFREELDVEWAGHPNWFFRLSKFSLPFLHHSSVPKTYFLSDLDKFPDDLQQWVLKPLYSFAGSGVIVGPSRADIDTIPVGERHKFVLQERIEYGGIVETPYGATKAEVRIMYIWLDELCAVANLVRMGRGKMMGVSFNKDMSWVGSSAGLYLD
jgi:hypothetical protein